MPRTLAISRLTHARADANPPPPRGRLAGSLSMPGPGALAGLSLAVLVGVARATRGAG